MAPGLKEDAASGQWDAALWSFIALNSQGHLLESRRRRGIFHSLDIAAWLAAVELKDGSGVANSLHPSAFTLVIRRILYAILRTRRLSLSLALLKLN
jgi:hypothetical protein